MPRTSSSRPVGVALIGYGQFGRFVASTLHQEKSVRLLAIMETEAHHRAEAQRRERNVAIYSSTTELLRQKQIEAVHLATPPFDHARHGQRILRAGKHLVMEKPLALRPRDAARLVRLAKTHNRVLAVNFVLRYNPLLQTLRALTHQSALGAPYRVSLVNIAAAVTPETHWFWDRRKSGGIHIEHGVHFFDAAQFFLAARPLRAEGTLTLRGVKNTEARATVDFDTGTQADFFHGFFSTKPLEETRWIITWKHARAEMSGWIPQQLTIHAENKRIAPLLRTHGFHVQRGSTHCIAKRVLRGPKEDLYRTHVSSLWRDVASAIRHGTPVSASGEAGYQSLLLAFHASNTRRALPLLGENC